MMRAAMLAIALLLPSQVLAQTQPVLKGDINAHDPTWTEVDGTQIVYWTGEQSTNGGAILAKTSADGVTWDDRGTIGTGVPEWVESSIGQVPPNLWAPTVSEIDGRHYLYFAASIFGRNTSVIGLMTNEALDPAKPTEGWVDRGPVLVTREGDNFNAIDPARIDTADGRAWLVFGSYWDGIKLRELDPSSGLLLASNTELYSLASRGGGPIEAPSILERDGKFYLFVSFDRCCRGTGSTYKIKVGRADAVTGPYLDKDGKPMLEGGGTLVEEKAGRFKGPGGQEAFATASGDILVYHYYDQLQYGLSQLQISPIRWTADGWPELDPLPTE